MTTYSMTPIKNGTRIRTDHNAFADVITSVNTGVVVVGDEVWEAPADGSEVKKGDKWLRVKSVGGITFTEVGWMAYIHKGVPICNNFKEVETTPPTEPPAPKFPEYFILTDPEGNTQRFNKA